MGSLRFGCGGSVRPGSLRRAVSPDLLGWVIFCDLMFCFLCVSLCCSLVFPTLIFSPLFPFLLSSPSFPRYCSFRFAPVGLSGHSSALTVVFDLHGFG